MNKEYMGCLSLKSGVQFAEEACLAKYDWFLAEADEPMIIM